MLLLCCYDLFMFDSVRQFLIQFVYLHVILIFRSQQSSVFLCKSTWLIDLNFSNPDFQVNLEYDKNNCKC